MRRQVKCVDTQQLADRDKCYKAADGKYYSSEAAYNFICKETVWRNKTYDLCSEECGYYDGNKHFLPPIFKSMLKEWAADFGWECVYKTVYCLADDFKWAVTTKQFSNEFRKSSYIGAIIGNNIYKVHKSIVDREKQIKQAEQLAKQVNADDMTMAQSNNKINDISNLLEDDD